MVGDGGSQGAYSIVQAGEEGFVPRLETELRGSVHVRQWRWCPFNSAPAEGWGMSKEANQGISSTHLVLPRSHPPCSRPCINGHLVAVVVDVVVIIAIVVATCSIVKWESVKACEVNNKHQTLKMDDFPWASENSYKHRYFFRLMMPTCRVDPGK